jgi:hypothetical protein
MPIQFAEHVKQVSSEVPHVRRRNGLVKLALNLVQLYVKIFIACSE